METVERKAGNFRSTGTSWLKTSVAVAAVALLSAGVAGCKPSEADPRTGVPLVRVATVQLANAAERSFTGAIAARVQSNLGFRVSGKIIERLVDTGQTVKAGQPLMKVDPVDSKTHDRCADQRHQCRSRNGNSSSRGRSALQKPCRRGLDIPPALRTGAICSR